MSNVVSQTEIQKYRENEAAIFPAGTIITPSARDWAYEHNIKICFGEPGSQDREACLRSAVSAVLKEFKQKGVSPDVKMVSEAVTGCLVRLGCIVEK